MSERNKLPTPAELRGTPPPEKVVLPTLKRGEYDLVNISLLGKDPITKRSFDECQVEYDKALRYAAWCEANTSRWNLVGHFRNRFRAVNLAIRLGMP